MGITAAAAATYTFWILLSSTKSNNKEKCKKAKNAEEQSRNGQPEKKSEQVKQSVLPGTIGIDQETKYEEAFRNKGADINRGMTSVYTLPASKPQAKTLGDCVGDVSKKCLEKDIHDNSRTPGKEESPSWSQLVAEEEEIQVTNVKFDKHIVWTIIAN